MQDRREKIAVLADDLTGALDCAAAFLSYGFSPFVSIGVEPPKRGEYDVLSLNMDTRRMTPAEAVLAVERALEQVESVGAKPLYVKIDSTLRGHPGLEIERVAAASGAAAVICPAFPATGRTVSDGELLVSGVPLADTEVGRDPLSPAISSDLAKLIQRDASSHVAQVRLHEVRGVVLREIVEAASAGDAPMICCDAETDDDLRLIAKAGLEANGLVFAGSAGLAGAIANVLDTPAGRSAGGELAMPDGPILVVTASQRSLADRQIDQAALRHALMKIPVTFTSGPGEAAEFDSASARQVIARGGHIALRATVNDELTNLSQREVRALADRITRELAQIVVSLCREIRPAAVVLIGGDTALAALTALGARGIFLRSQPLPGVPVGILSGGELDGVPVATKAGAFGDESSLSKLFDYLLNGRTPN